MFLREGTVDAAKLVWVLLQEPWHSRCEIIPKYMPRYPRPDTKPRVAIRFDSGTDHDPFLRFSGGPRQGYFWDVYGDDFGSIEHAIFALANAPAPRSVSPFEFKIPLDEKATTSS